MIIDALLDLAYAVLSGMLAALPDWTMTVPPEIANLVNFMSAFDSIAPFHELMEVAGITVALLTALYGYKLIIKIIDWITALIP